MKYYRHKHTTISPNDFNPREIITIWKTNGKSWYVKAKIGWHQCSDPIRHGYSAKEISEKEAFIELL